MMVARLILVFAFAALATATKVEPQECTIEYVLFNAETSIDDGKLEDYFTTNGVLCIPKYNVNIQAKPSSVCATTTSFDMKMNGPIRVSRNHTVGPYMIFDNKWRGRRLMPGRYTIDSSMLSTKVNVLESFVIANRKIEFEAKHCGCKIEYIMFNADTDKSTGELNDKECIRNNEFNIEARPTPHCPTTVRADMRLVGPIYHEYEHRRPRSLDSSVQAALSPYTIFGDHSDTGDIIGKKYQAGDYTIFSEVFSANEGSFDGHLVARRKFDFTISAEHCNNDEHLRGRRS